MNFQTFLALTLALAVALPVQAALNVVATLPDYAALALEIGGSKIKVTSLARGTEDPHFVDAKPSFIRLLNQADVLLEGGAEQESCWLPPILERASNRRIHANAPGRVILARGVKLLDVLTGPMDRSLGHVHTSGNPHFNLDPVNAKIMAGTIAEAFAKLDPANAAHYQASLKRFAARLDEKLAEWMQQAAAFRGSRILTYSKSYDYLAARFGLEVVGQIESKPGFEATPQHLATLIPRAKGLGIRFILIEPNRAPKTPQNIADATGARLLVLPIQVGGVPEAKTYFDLIDYDLRLLSQAAAAR